MKKKIETLLRDGNLTGNAEFIPLNKAQQSAKKALERAKKEKMEAKHAYREALGNGEKDHDRLLELLTAFRQAQYMHRYQRAGHRLAKHRLHRWLETWLKTAEVPHEPKKAAATRSKTKKSETAVSAAKPTEKAAKKAQ